ncbi:uncharacterized protein L969DRAFT_90599 [Mixia osmundae IAM 14324]|uniref:Inositol polyphosphate-related phosphatase domain-containing protein n=1 Tax=Mixia osmundae (strain CBS 9802 / IAM 14324 / JCM 22182 / KY 12970) TaxID=764103 RepID=G7E1G1_MIXOS|nr:uncharacterized protein L969DRAFT_90599 [Mixia osmundae IAM 14324]KEI36625.1 hypothetical protein L969DRAFT_90599 [Mixia osmundae IAM 14324]GAA96671.1 hypothetical protein E5Q_03342 [Mixia osmundae IAM 14324]
MAGVAEAEQDEVYDVRSLKSRFEQLSLAKPSQSTPATVQPVRPANGSRTSLLSSGSSGQYGTAPSLTRDAQTLSDDDAALSRRGSKVSLASAPDLPTRPSQSGQSSRRGSSSDPLSQVVARSLPPPESMPAWRRKAPPPPLPLERPSVLTVSPARSLSLASSDNDSYDESELPKPKLIRTHRLYDEQHSPVTERKTYFASPSSSPGEPTALAEPSPKPVVPPRPTHTLIGASAEDPFDSRPLTPSQAPPKVPPRPSQQALANARSVQTANGLTAPPVPPRPLTPPRTEPGITSLAGLPVPPSRTAAAAALAVPIRRSRAMTSSSFANGNDSESDESPEADDDSSAKGRADELPESAFANRRPPVTDPPRSCHSKHQILAFAVHDRLVCAAGQHHLRVYDSLSGFERYSIALASSEHRITALCFRAEANPRDSPRIVWAGTRDGVLAEIDIQQDRVVQHRSSLHTGRITTIQQIGRSMVTIDESGKVQTFTSDVAAGDQSTCSITDVPRTQRIHLFDHQTAVLLIGNKIWTAQPPPKGARGPLIRVYDPLATSGAFSLTSKPAMTTDTFAFVGAVTSGTIVPRYDHVYLGHETGHVSVWSQRTLECLKVVRISNYQVTALCGVTDLLWAGFRTGSTYVYDLSKEPWIVRKVWRAHSEGVVKIIADLSVLLSRGELHVVSAGLDGYIHFWDGFLKTDWTDARLDARKEEYCTFRDISVFISSWNVDANKPRELNRDGKDMTYLHDLLSSSGSPDLLVFGFQEMIDLESKKLTAKTMLFGRKRADSVYSDAVSHTYRAWHETLAQSVRMAMDPAQPYEVLQAENLVGLFTCIFVKSSERAALRDVALTNVKTGMGGRYGNKGAILARLVVDDTSLCFINMHLAAGQRHLRQRNKDLVDILEAKSSFAEHPVHAPYAYYGGGSGVNVFDHEVVWAQGDLNYRIDMRRDAVLEAIKQGDLEALWAQDQLHKQMKTNQSFRLRAFTEAKISFNPTYKYDPGTDEYDSSEKKRIPAWCDRILWRASHKGQVTPLSYQRHEVKISDHRPISARFMVKAKRIQHSQRDALLAGINAEWKTEQARLASLATETYFGP